MLRRWVLLTRGQVRVRVTGASLPRFLNMCAAHDLLLRHMERTAWDEMNCVMSVEDFRALRRYMGRTGCRVHITRRAGVPFAAARLRPRTVLWGGLLALLALTWVLTTRIWSIEANISPALPRAQIMQQLDELGVHIGASRRSINVQQVRWRMLRQQPDLAFLALNISGNQLSIEAQATTDHPEMLDQQASVKVVAERDGVIKDMRVQEGQPLVKVGDAVSVGDTLVSALVPPTKEGGSYHLTHARAEIEAYTSYQLTLARPKAAAQKAYTGRTKKQFALVFGKKRLNLYLGSGISGGTCDKIVETKSLWLSQSVVFPVSLVVQTYSYYECTPVQQTLQTMGQDMVDRALANIAAGMDGEILSHDETVSEKNGAAVLRLQVQAAQQIGVQALDNSEIPETPPPPAE